MRRESDARWGALARSVRQALIEHDLIGMRGIGRLPFGSKVEGVETWLNSELDHKILGYDASWTRPYIQRAAVIAQNHAAQYVNGRVDPGRVADMQALAVAELTGIVGAAQQQLTRCISHCLMANTTPHKMANRCSGVIRAMRQRGRAMSEHTIVKTFNTCTLSAYRDAGVRYVGVIPERKSKFHIARTQHGKVLVKDADVDLDALFATTEALVEKAEINHDYDVVELANRSRDASTVFIDKHVPEVLKDTGIRPDQTLPWHELSEWTMQNRGLSYLPAHKIATQIERRRVEQLAPGEWDEYQDEMGGLIADAEERGYGREPPNQDRRVFDAGPPDEPRNPHGRWTTGGSGDLPMDEVSRMQRANAQGFDTSTTWYHGSGTSFSAFRSGRPVWLARNPQFASSVASMQTWIGGAPQVYPVFVRGKIGKVSDFKKSGSSIETMKQRGFSGFDDGGALQVFDPKNVRSVYATFHPTKVDSSVLSDSAIGYTSALTGKKSSRIFKRKRFKPIEEVPSYEEVDVVTAGDNDVCIICEDISDDGPYELDEAEELIPAHPWCLPGDSLVLPIGRIAAASKRFFDGDIVILGTARGYRLEITPNHPILTNRGWAAAASLDVGDDVICHLGSQRMSCANEQNENIPASIEDVANTLAKFGKTVKVPVSSSDFHGDGVAGDVDIVATNGMLWDEIKSALMQHGAKSQFVFRDVVQCFLKSLGSLQQFLHRSLSTPYNLVSFGYLQLALSSSHAAPLDGFLLRRSSESNAPVGQPSFDKTAVKMILARECDDSSAVDVLINDLIADRLVSKSIRSFAGHVYNLQTSAGCFIAQGIVTHNCRCAFAPAGKYERDALGAPPDYISAEEQAEIDDALEGETVVKEDVSNSKK
jgi:hypothetical protein